MPTALRSVGLLDVLSSTPASPSGAAAPPVARLVSMPVCAASLRNLVRKAGYFLLSTPDNYRYWTLVPSVREYHDDALWADVRGLLSGAYGSTPWARRTVRMRLQCSAN